MPQFIYSMKNLRKITPQGREILKGIWLSFYYGAKIGVLGHNGAGKSTLLRIMAGLDRDFDGEAGLLAGYTVGMLPQEPALPAGTTVQAVVEEAVAAKRAVLDRYTELSANYSEETAEEFSRLQDQIDAGNLWELDRQLEIAMDALRLPPAEPGGLHPLRRREAAGRPLPAPPPAARPAAARRAHQPPRRRVGGLAGAPPPGVQGHGRRRHPRPLLPRQRRRLDPGARPRRRHPLGGELLLLAGAEAGAAGDGGEGVDGAPAHAGARAGVDPHGAARAPGQGQGAADRLRAAPRRRAGGGEARLRQRDPHPRRPAPGRQGDRGRRPAQGVRRHAADRRPLLPPPARRHRRRHRPQRRRQDDAVPHDRRRGEARRRHARDRRQRRRSPTSIRAASGSTASAPSGRRCPTAAKS